MGRIAGKNSRTDIEHDRQNSQHDSAGGWEAHPRRAGVTGDVSVGSAKLQAGAPAGGAPPATSPGAKTVDGERGQRRRPVASGLQFRQQRADSADDYAGGGVPLLYPRPALASCNLGTDLRGLRGHQGAGGSRHAWVEDLQIT